MSKKSLSRSGSVIVTVFPLAAVVLFLAASGSTQRPSTDRILRPIDSSQIAALRGTANPLARPQFDQGRVSPERQLGRLALTFRLSPAQQADLDELLREQQDRSSPNYHKWLTPEQYASRFGMTQNDLAKVSAWLQSQGLSVDGISRNRNEIFFSGSVGQVEFALKTEIHNYLIRGETHFANASDISLPAAFSSEVLGVRGLNSFSPKPRIRKPIAQFTSNVSGNHFVIPGDFATIYDVPSTYDGTGQSIAVIGQTTISTGDIDAFRTASSLPARTSSNFQQVLAPGTGTGAACSGDETEADLDLEWSEGVAKNVTIIFVYAGLGTGTGNTCTNRASNVFDAFDYAITNDVAPIISVSYGNCEANLGGASPGSFVFTLQQEAQEAIAQGQTISGPAGDDGAADCDTGNSATQGLAVDAPASIPEVTGVGGSEFMGDAAATVTSGCAAATTYWKGECNSTDPGGTAISYIPEEAWNDTASSIANGGGFAATGGGASIVFAKPTWQTGTGVPADGQRDVPDIALNASSAHDSYLICSQDYYTGSPSPVPTTCANGFRDSAGDLAAVGGTSAGAPTFAGILALINQATSSNGLGNVNPTLYTIAASSPNAFHDITTGNNKVPCTTGTANCPSGTTQIGFSAGTGYDQVSGLGSLDVSNLIASWSGNSTPPPGNFAVEGAASGSTATITVDALNGFASTVNLTCTVNSGSGTCSLNPTSVDLSSATSGTSTLSVTASADLRLPNGKHPRGLWLTTSGIFAVCFFGGISSRRKRIASFALVLSAIAISALGCGGSSTPSANQQNQNQTFTVTVTGSGMNSSGTALTHNTTVSLTVQ